MGMVIGHVMTNGEMTKRTYVFNKKESQLPRFTLEAQAYYAKALVELVHSCLQPLT